MESAFKLGKLFGIEFRVHLSWFLIFALVTFFLSRDVFPGVVKGESTLTYWLMGAGATFLFFISVLIHETGHSIAARNNGIPVSSITLFLFGGAAQMTREPPSAAAELKMAISGPAASLALAVLFWVIYQVSLGGLNTMAAMALWLYQINLIVAIFNLLPGFPLDGGRVLRGLWWHFRSDYEEATRVAVFCGRVVGVLMIAAGTYIVIINNDWLAGIWLGILGWYLESSARLSLKQFRLQLWMKGKTVRGVIEEQCPVVDASVSLAELKQRYPDERCFRVAGAGQPEAAFFVTEGNGHPDSALAGKLAQPLLGAIVVAPDSDLLSLAQQMNEQEKDMAVVKAGEAVIGLVFLDRIIEIVNRSIAGQKEGGGPAAP